MTLFISTGTRANTLIRFSHVAAAATKAGAKLFKPTIKRIIYRNNPPCFTRRIEFVGLWSKYQLSVENMPVVSLNPLMNRKKVKLG
jgi:hypothetical protein